jgi:hypothetical protein
LNLCSIFSRFQFLIKFHKKTSFTIKVLNQFHLECVDLNLGHNSLNLNPRVFNNPNWKNMQNIITNHSWMCKCHHRVKIMHVNVYVYIEHNPFHFLLCEYILLIEKPTSLTRILISLRNRLNSRYTYTWSHIT